MRSLIDIHVRHLPNQNENSDRSKKVISLVINKVVDHPVIHSILVI